MGVGVIWDKLASRQPEGAGRAWGAGFRRFGRTARAGRGRGGALDAGNEGGGGG